MRQTKRLKFYLAKWKLFLIPRKLFLVSPESEKKKIKKFYTGRLYQKDRIHTPVWLQDPRDSTPLIFMHCFCLFFRNLRRVYIKDLQVPLRLCVPCLTDIILKSIAD